MYEEKYLIILIIYHKKGVLNIMVVRSDKKQQWGFLLMEIMVALMVFTILSFTITFGLCAIRDHIIYAQQQNSALQKGRSAAYELLYAMDQGVHEDADISIVYGNDLMPTVAGTIPLAIKPVKTVCVIAQGLPNRQKVVLTTVLAS